MRTLLLALLATCALAACHTSTCRDACQEERESCLEEASSQREEDMCRGSYEQCFWVCDDEDLQLQSEVDAS
jgi:hypothetical protein